MEQHRILVRILQVLWLLIATISFVALIASIPTLYQQYQIGCEANCLWGQLPEESFQQLLASGANIELIATILLVALIAERLSEFFLGGMLVWKGAGNWNALLWGFVIITPSMSIPDFRVAIPLSLANFFDVIGLLNIVIFTLAIITFPDGKFKPRWTLVITTAYLIISVLVWATPTLPQRFLSLANLVNLLDISFVFFIFGIVGYRYFREFTRLQRQQAKWVVYALAMNACILLVMNGIVPLLVPETNPTYLLASKFVTLFVFVLFFAALTISILQYRLWDIDIFIKRTLVYGFLTAFVVGAYALLVGGLGAIFHTSDQFLFSIIATAVIAILFQPLRERWQRVVDRMLFGDRNNPYTVISRLSEQMGMDDVSGTLLPGIAEMVAQALKLPYVAIALKHDDHFKIETVFGQPADRGRVESLPLTYRQEVVGQMTVGQMVGDKALDRTAYQLLENIARQVGVVAYAVQLNVALQNSRQQIVTAREEERRRLRRDLHDGLGPTLASHTIKVGTARLLIDTEPQTAQRILDELETSLANSFADICQLVYNLRPPSLDQLGFIPALNDFLQQYNGETQFTLIAPDEMPQLPAAVEVASYRIVQEAVNNVIRHAQAQHCRVQIRHNGVLEITIHDNGIGLPVDRNYGVGLTSMSERAQELGGTFAISTVAQEGTCVDVRIPL
jgi:signal transduction histidine kinase